MGKVVYECKAVIKLEDNFRKWSVEVLTVVKERRFLWWTYYEIVQNNPRIRAKTLLSSEERANSDLDNFRELEYLKAQIWIDDRRKNTV